MFKKLIIYIIFSTCIVQNAYSNFDLKARTAILLDYHSGEILYEKEPDRSIYPASMTKIMTAIIAFDLIKSGDLSLVKDFVLAAILSFFAALLSIRFMMYFLTKYSFTPYVVYRVLLSLILLAIIY